MTKRELAKLQKMINRTVDTHNAAKEAHDALMNWCSQQYGFEPGDVDADYIIDSLGGCGVAEAIPAEQFDQIMQEHS